MSVRRIFVEKRQGFFDIPAQQLCADLIETFRILDLKAVRIFQRYDVEGLSDEQYAAVKNVVFAEAPVDVIYEEELPTINKGRVFAVEYLPGQYDQRADSAAQCIQLITQGERPEIRTARVYALVGTVDDETLEKVKGYLINKIESREAALNKPETLLMEAVEPADVEVLEGFTAFSEKELREFVSSRGLAMSYEDLAFCQKYFRDEEKRQPTITEIKVLDTYWSDHCRHTTFTTAIDKVEVEEGFASDAIAKAYEKYLEDRRNVYGSKQRDVTLMDIAVMGMKELKREGLLDDLDASDEINACSIVVPAEINGEIEEWLVMFKNETHNHPTEIEPFGGAATCLGGAIRDPLSGRTYVYQAMRVTGAADPRTAVKDTLPGKLPQKKITQGAASGYSSYGNQVGLATGQVAEVYHPGFVAKRLEIGAVIAAAPRMNVVREAPKAGDLVILVGGRTGRDGIGGATGSSKGHTEASLTEAGAEVQKGNPPTERKIQRLFRNPEASRLIKRCNDFGAGGVAVAIGELTDGLMINLDKVPKKYEGLDGTELAISASQERMAVVVGAEDRDKFIAFADEENLEATVVAVVTETPRLLMRWRGNYIVNLSRAFLDTNGVRQHVSVRVGAISGKERYLHTLPKAVAKETRAEDAWLKNMADLNVCSQKGLVERFDSSIGAATVTMPFGGKKQLTPSEGMVAKLPVTYGETGTATAMAYGFNPYLMSWSPFHGAVYAIVEATAKMVAMGAPADRLRLTLQEFFESLGKEPSVWGKPFAALLGALWAQHELGIPAIGGKDSMSGTFMDLKVPPSLAAFAVGVLPAAQAVSSEFKYAGSTVYMFTAPKDSRDLPLFARYRKAYAKINELMRGHKILSASTVKMGGLAAAVSKMCLGNGIGFRFTEYMGDSELYLPNYGAVIFEVGAGSNLAPELAGLDCKVIGETTVVPSVVNGNMAVSLQEIQDAWTAPLESIFPTQAKIKGSINPSVLYTSGNRITRYAPIAKPRVVIPVFPGTNCEYDTARAFARAGAEPHTVIIRNLTPAGIEETIETLEKEIRKSQMLMFPGGFSGGDEPDGSGKFIVAMFRNPRLTEAVMRLLHRQDGLILGICNGFQALIKLGLVPYGEIRDLAPNSPTLTTNQIGRHVSTMVQTKVVSNLSPWFNNVNVGELHTIAVSHGEGRFFADQEVIAQLRIRGQIATQYVDEVGEPSLDIAYNPNGSVNAIEGITSPDGRVLGKMGHSERIGEHVAMNVPGVKDQQLFEAGVKYYS